MTRRGWLVFGAFVVVDALDFVLTVRNHLEYRARPGTVTVMPLGQLLGWASSGAIFLALVAVLISAVRARAFRSAAKRRSRDEKAQAQPEPGRHR